MKMTSFPVLCAAWTMIVTPAEADLYITDFTAPNGAFSAVGVWRNSTTSTSIPFAIVALFPSLEIHMPASQILLTFPKGSISYIRRNLNLGSSWTTVTSGLENTDHWVADKSTYGGRSFFQGVAPPPPP